MQFVLGEPGQTAVGRVEGRPVPPSLSRVSRHIFEFSFHSPPALQPGKATAVVQKHLQCIARTLDQARSRPSMISHRRAFADRGRMCAFVSARHVGGAISARLQGETPFRCKIPFHSPCIGSRSCSLKSASWVADLCCGELECRILPSLLDGYSIETSMTPRDGFGWPPKTEIGRPRGSTHVDRDSPLFRNRPCDWLARRVWAPAAASGSGSLRS
jgi:hypothetical protein